MKAWHSQSDRPDQHPSNIHRLPNDRPDKVRGRGAFPDVSDKVDGPTYAHGLDALEDGAAADFDDVVDTAAICLEREREAGLESSVDIWMKSREGDGHLRS